jgi:hypothetical protein
MLEVGDCRSDAVLVCHALGDLTSASGNPGIEHCSQTTDQASGVEPGEGERRADAEAAAL